MRSILVLICFLSAIASTTAFSAMPAPMTSLNDLPSRFEGFAGGFTTRVKAVFEITKITKVAKDDPDSSYPTYHVDAAITMGKRIINVTRITMRPYADLKTATEFFMHTSDELVSSIQGTLFYDEASNSFTLTDVPNNAQRHLVLHAKAKSN